MSDNATEEVAQIRLAMLLNGQRVVNVLVNRFLTKIEGDVDPDDPVVFEANIIRSLGRSFWKNQMIVMEQVIRKYGDTLPPIAVVSEMARTHVWLDEFDKADQKITSRFEELKLAVMEKELSPEELEKMQSAMLDALQGKNLGKST